MTLQAALSQMKILRHLLQRLPLRSHPVPLATTPATGTTAVVPKGRGLGTAKIGRPGAGLPAVARGKGGERVSIASYSRQRRSSLADESLRLNQCFRHNHT